MNISYIKKLKRLYSEKKNTIYSDDRRSYNTHQYKNTGIPPKYKLWGDSIDIDIENSDMQVLNNNIKKDTSLH